IADDARYDVFRLADAAIGGDAGRALRIVAGLRAEGEELIPLLGWMLSQLRVLQRLADAGSNLAAALRSERIWPARENLYRRALRSADVAHWERCIAQAARIDCIAKGQQLDAAGKSWGDGWRELERLIAAIAKPRAAAELIA
ncbi:MAG TPA: DNA polymerase III subunit delta, partial [Rhodanobacteraceae bacterium]|nr:DNA polymerase III subunit delta [Rhodanobacteraceae bacterium]